MEIRPAPAALLFDLDDTLIPEADLLAAAYRAAAQAIFGAGEAAQQAGRVRAAARSFWQAHVPTPRFCERIHVGPSDGLSADFNGAGAQLAKLRAFISTYRAHAFDGAVPEPRRNLQSAAVREAWWKARMGLQGVFPGAVELLTALRASGRYRMALVTNGASDFQRRKAAATGIARYFDAIIVASDVGAAKPSPQPFRAALDALGVRAREAVMIGNDRARDLDGAHRLGIGTLWVQPHTRPAAGAITDLAEVPALIGC